MALKEYRLSKWSEVNMHNNGNIDLSKNKNKYQCSKNNIN